MAISMGGTATPQRPQETQVAAVGVVKKLIDLLLREGRLPDTKFMDSDGDPQLMFKGLMEPFQANPTTKGKQYPDHYASDEIAHAVGYYAPEHQG